VADFSVAETAEGVVRVYRNEGKTLPSGWILDADGNPSQDPNDFYGPPRLPFGGEKGYRGFALGLLVEVMAGLLAGNNRLANQDGNGLCFVVMKVSAFHKSATDFVNLVTETSDYVKSRNECEVLLPGEPEQRIRAKRLREGIPVDNNTWNSILAAAEQQVLCSTAVS
jgi:uncharacterized oxidoreductase